MAGLVLVGRYIKNASRHNTAGLVRYIGTREGVEKLPPGKDFSPATKKQIDLIDSIVKYDNSATKSPEYIAYDLDKNRANATQFISSFIENHPEKVEELDKLVKYMAERPGVEKIGGHGLFSMNDEKIDLEKVANEIGNHKGNVWSSILSLTREDAEKLGYNNAQAWKDLLQMSSDVIAKEHDISLNNLRWYAAFHDTSTHPHVHLLVYSTNPKEGFRTKEATKRMRDYFTKQVFKDSLHKIYVDQTELRNKTKDLFHDKLDAAINDIKYRCSDNFVLEMQLTELRKNLKNVKGKKVYGYLPPSIKKEVDEILKTITSSEDISSLYSMWNDKNREKLSIYFNGEKPDIPIEENKEFRSLKNEIISQVLSIPDDKVLTEHIGIRQVATNLLLGFLNLLSNSYDKKNDKLEGQVDSKLRAKINEKKAAQGIRVTTETSESDDEEEYNGMTM